MIADQIRPKPEHESVHEVGISFHEYAKLFPLLEGAEAEAFREDIRKNGVREPIVFLGDAILDGRNRYLAARECKIEYPFVQYEGSDPLGFVISLNLKRRHLSETQRATAAAKIANIKPGTFAGNQHVPAANLQTPQVSQAEAAAMLNVSERTVASAAKAIERGVPELVVAMETGGVSAAAAADVSSLPVTEQLAILRKNNPKALLEAAKEVRAERADRKRTARTALLTELSNRNAPLPERKYPVIYADPPWQYDFSPSDDRSVENHYPTMPIEEICALPVGDLATPDAMLFLWAPPSFIKKGLMVLEAWGFELATSMVWVKDRIGTGIYVRQRHEYLLLGKRGQPIVPRPGSQPDSVIEAPRQAHSAKPEAVYELIEQMYPDLPKIELFSRSPRSGFDAWGNQAEAA